MSSAPSIAAPMSVVASATGTSRRPLPSVIVTACASSTGAKASASRRQNRTLWPASAASAAAA